MPTKILSLVIFIISLSGSSLAADAPYQPHSDIYQAVTDYITRNIGPDSEYEISIAPLDSRLKLPECPDDLEAFTPGNQTLRAGRLSIGVRCVKTAPWSIYSSVTLKLYAHVVVLKQPARRGQILTQRHLTIEKRDTATLRNGYIKRLELIENKQVVRHLAAGTALHEGLIAEPTLVKRGDKIIISATAPSYDIRMQGVALMNGIKGQSIKVKNVSSGRTIAAKVIKPGLVSVMY
ncbi:MAG: flagellar basal body P-ring formation chaperone FlgA [Gammaproteobacteria bacterium]